MHQTAKNKLVACFLLLWCPFNQFSNRLLFKWLGHVQSLGNYRSSGIQKYCLYTVCRSGIETSLNLVLSCFWSKTSQNLKKNKFILYAKDIRNKKKTLDSCCCFFSLSVAQQKLQITMNTKEMFQILLFTPAFLLNLRFKDVWLSLPSKVQHHHLILPSA